MAGSRGCSRSVDDLRAIGGQLDSLADAVAFGLAPAMCMAVLVGAGSAGCLGFSRPGAGDRVVGFSIRFRRVRDQQTRVTTTSRTSGLTDSSACPCPLRR